jgi:hypothetical protein
MEKRDFYTALKEKVIDKIRDGKKHIVIWGFTSTSIKLVADLNYLGLLNRVTGIIDSNSQKSVSKIFNVRIWKPQHISSLKMDVLVLASDEDKESFLNDFVRWDKRFPDIVLSGSKHYSFQNRLYTQIVNSMPVRSIAGGYPNMLIHIFQSLDYLVKRNLKGVVAEFGVFQGGTLAIIAKTLRNLNWKGKIFGFDVFGGKFKKQSQFDIFSKQYTSSYENVRRYCEPYNVDLIEGDICDTYKILKDIPLMFTFFDTDLYSPTRVALELCFKQTVKGGIIALDHYFSEGWEETIGERIAAQEVLKNKNYFHLHGTGIFIKQ